MARELRQCAATQSDSQFFEDPDVLEEIEQAFEKIANAQNSIRQCASQHQSSPLSTPGDPNTRKIDNANVSPIQKSVQELAIEKTNPASAFDVAKLWNMGECSSVLHPSQLTCPNVEGVEHIDNITDEDNIGASEHYSSPGSPARRACAEPGRDEKVSEARDTDVDPIRSNMIADSSIQESCTPYSFRFFSRFGRENASLFRDNFMVDELRVLDWCFYTNTDFVGNFVEDVVDIASDTSTLAYFNGPAILSKDDVMTMVKGQPISTAIVDCFAFILNHRENGSRLFFSTQSMIAWIDAANHMEMETRQAYEAACQRMRRCWRKWLDEQAQQYQDLKKYDMFFFPCCYKGHYTLFVIEVQQMRIHLIDNRIDIGHEFQERLGNILREQFAIFMCDHSQRIDQLESYVFHVMKFPWQANNGTNDCGIYLIEHMDMYTGSWPDHALRLVSYRTVCRGRITVTILTSPLNVRKDDVLLQAEIFSQKKRLSPRLPLLPPRKRRRH